MLAMASDLLFYCGLGWICLAIVAGNLTPSTGLGGINLGRTHALLKSISNRLLATAGSSIYHPLIMQEIISESLIGFHTNSSRRGPETENQIQLCLSHRIFHRRRGLEERSRRPAPKPSGDCVGGNLCVRGLHSVARLARCSVTGRYAKITA